MTELRTLDVSFNRIKQFPYGPGELPNLHKLDVRGNPLTSIPSFLKNTKISILVSEWAYIARTNEIELARVGRLFVAGQDTSAILSRSSGLAAPDSNNSCFSIRSQQLHSMFQMYFSTNLGSKKSRASISCSTRNTLTVSRKNNVLSKMGLCVQSKWQMIQDSCQQQVSGLLKKN